MNRLFIRTYESQIEGEDQTAFALADEFEWMLLSPTSDVLHSGKGKSADQLQTYLKEQNLVYGDLVFLPPEHRVQVRRITLAQGQHRHADQVIPFLLEESLGQSPDELHYTVLNKSNKEWQWVSIVDKQVMASWLDDLKMMGWLQVIVLPVNSLIPFWPEQDTEADFLFTSDLNLLYKDQDSVSCLPKQGANYLPKREKYNLCCDQAEVDGFGALAASFEILSPWSNQSVNSKGKLETWLYIVATRVQSNSKCLLANLCHGEFGRQTQFFSQLKPWLWVGVFAVFSLAVELYLTHQQTQALNAKADDIYQKTSTAFLKLAPDEGRISYLDRQIKGRIQRAKQGDAKTQKGLTVYEVMALVDQVREQVSGEHRITKFDFANKEYRLDWQAGQRDTLDSIQTALEKKPFQVVFEQVAKRGEVYVASIKLKEEAK
ncbi:general secretion pathway protein L [Marinomonas sp. MED121]|uniref:type II secretion system protein GspL n=1 Tax=Marinomonas sp. MED121 TaxID=314277 RepID=UPI0000690DAB|nr:type II secretion system protein GspL [Marinomonas sp. MED121]EAQ65201.1 general secretion pathway protein L [Marinomonas sp. MED121]